MLDQLFKKLPTRSHARSESNPHLRDSLNNSFFPAACTWSDNHSSDHVPIAPTRRDRGRGNGQLHHSLDDRILAQPVNTHQPESDQARQIQRNLPPLLTSPIDLSTPAKCHNTDLQDFAPSPERSPQPSPTRLKRLSIPLLTGDHTERVQKEPTNKTLAGWFNGESEPISIGILPSPTKERFDPLAVMPPTRPIQTTPKPAITSRFSFFTTKSSPAKPSVADLDPNDEFLTLDISTALFPSGPADPFSPSSFKNLVQNAEGLLARLQAAYRERTISLRDMTAEKDAVGEELEGANTRSKHLKIQLDDMSAKVTEQDNAMMELVDELANLKRLRAEEEDARKRTIRPVQPSISTPNNAARGPGTTTNAVGRRIRRDRLSSASTTDGDSEDESSAESLFSKGPVSSPRMSLSSVSTTSSPETYHSPDLSLNSISDRQIAHRQLPRTPSCKHNRLPSHEQSVIWSCANCNGGGASEAWGVVSMLKEENKCLKERVQHVEGALEGCLDVVARLG